MARNIKQVLQDVEAAVKTQTEGKIVVTVSVQQLLHFSKSSASQSYLAGSGEEIRVDGTIGPHSEALLEKLEGGPSIISELGL